ncbi:unnamed protein product [Boreogadus saida]
MNAEHVLRCLLMLCFALFSANASNWLSGEAWQAVCEQAYGPAQVRYEQAVCEQAYSPAQVRPGRLFVSRPTAQLSSGEAWQAVCEQAYGPAQVRYEQAVCEQAYSPAQVRYEQAYSPAQVRPGRLFVSRPTAQLSASPPRPGTRAPPPNTLHLLHLPREAPGLCR